MKQKDVILDNVDEFIKERKKYGFIRWDAEHWKMISRWVEACFGLKLKNGESFFGVKHFL